LETERIVEVTIQDPIDGQLHLAKSAGEWVLPEADDFACKADAVSSLLDKVASLRGDRLVAETKSSHERLQVAEESYARQVELVQQDGTTYAFYLGSSPSYGAAHVRVEGQDQVYLVSGLSSTDLSTQVARWIDTAYLVLQQDQVIAISLENSSGSLDFVRPNSENEWTMAGLTEGETLSQSAVNALLGQISSVQMVRPLGQEQKQVYGLDDPAALLTVRTSNEEGTSQEYTLAVGAPSENDTYLAKSSESPYYVEIAAYLADAWIPKTKEAFLELPPTPTPES
jgi:hypothetical protein